MQFLKIYLVVSLLFLFGNLWSQIPDDYYDGTEGLSGQELRQALHDIIDDHIEYSYNDLRDFILFDTDEDPDNSENVILIYSGISRDKDDFGGNVGQWNREHTWAKSHGDFGNLPAEGTDAHHVRPADVQINSTRSNLDFDNGGSPVAGCPGCKVDSDSFEPGDAVKGDVARMIFYMATRYMGGNGELLLNVVDEVNTSPEPLHGKLSTLIEWHEEDPPDEFEQNRNEVVFGYQENRNPFIDHPEFVEEVWGDPTSVFETKKMEIKVYPNPVFHQLNIAYRKNNNFTYELYNYSGVMVTEGILSPGKTSLNISDFVDGLYLLVVQDMKSKTNEQFKLIKTSK